MKNNFTVRDGIATVELTQGLSMRVAEADLPLISAHRWRAHRGRTTFYAMTSVRRPDGGRTTLRAHRPLAGLGFGDTREVDHDDGDGLNNTRANLRVTDSAGNQHNQHGKHPRRHGEAPTSRHPGVCWDKANCKWHARICLDWTLIHLGRYDDELDAAAAYDRAKAARDAGGSIAEIRAAARGR
jgi:hypothetical protein